MSAPSNYMIVVLGGFPLLLMACFLCFMGRNILTRDVYYRIHDVVITRPLSNYRIVLAKVLALVLVGWLPIVLYVGSVYLIAYLQTVVEIDFAAPFQSVAAAKFLLLTCPVTLAFVAVLSVLCNQILRNNLLSLAALLTTVIFGSFLLTRVSYSQFPLFEGLPLVGNIGSELNPESVSLSDVVRYLGFIFAIVSLFFVGVVSYRRKDVFARRNLIGGLVGGMCLVVCLGLTTNTALTRDAKFEAWSKGTPTDPSSLTSHVDLEKLEASVQVTPGRQMTVQVELALRVLSDPVDGVLSLWLNPGFLIEEIKLDGHVAGFKFDAQGALQIELDETLEPSQPVSILISYSGTPDLDYGYLDSSTDASKIPMWDQLLSYLGDVHGIFDPSYVALPQELNWLPSTYRPLYQLRTSKDFFLSSISLTLPKDWEAALPGRRVTSSSTTPPEQTKTYEFTTDNPISSIGLYAGPLISASRTVKGISFEILLSERQLASQEFLSASIDSLVDALAEELEANQSEGFALSCTNFRFIAVPQRLRVYGGGTFLPSIHSGKCSYLLREFDLLTIDWDEAVPSGNGLPLSREEYLVLLIKNRFRFGFEGNNFSLDLFNSYWDHEIGIVGPEAETLGLILEYLNDLVWYPSMDGFSASGYLPEAMGRTPIGPQPTTLILGGQFHAVLARHHLNRVFKPMMRHVDLVESIVSQRLDSEDLRRLARDTSIQQIMASELDPFLVESLRLKCAHLSFQLYQVLEEEGTKRLLNELLTRYRYSNFGVDELYSVSADLGLPVPEILGDWFSATDQPRYVLSGAETYRKDATDEMEEQFQTYFHVMNKGAGIGVFRTSVTTEMGGSNAWGTQLAADYALASPDFRYGASSVGPVVFLEPGQSVEIGIVSELEPIRVLLQPLNITLGGGRIAIPTKVIEDTRNLDLSRVDELHGFRDSSWQPPIVNPGIVVDDLDPSFSVENDKQVSEVKTWRRVDYPSAWGMTRRTMVYCDSDNPKSITFRTDLPHTGTWGLEFHLPDLRGQYGDYQQGVLPRGRIGTGVLNFYFWQSFAGEYTFTLNSGEVSKDLSLSVKDGDYGWVRVAEAFLESGTASVSVKPRNSDENLFGDAIRWVQIEDGE